MSFIEVLCESCGKEHRAKHLTVRQCAACAATRAPVVQDEVNRLQGSSDAHIYAVKQEATLALRTVSGDQNHNWRMVKACDRILMARELPSIPLNQLERIKSITDKKFVHRG